MQKKIIILSLIGLVAAGIFFISILWPRIFQSEQNTQVFVPLSSSGEGADPYSKDTIIARGDWSYPPFEYIDDSGKPAGFNIDILSRIGEIMNIDIRIKLGPWNTVRQELEKGEIDLLAGMYKTKERDKKVDFTIPHFITSYGVFFRNDSRIQNIVDIDDKRILVQTGDLGHDYLIQNNIGKEIVTVDEWDLLLPSLLQGKADCVVMGMVQGMKLLREKGYNNIRVLSQPFIQRPYCIAVQEEEAELLAVLNEGLNLLKMTGEYDSIYQKWFGIYEDFEPFNHRVLRIMSGGILALVVIIITVILLNYALRRQVQKQTAELRSTLEALKQANNTKDRFLAGISHELRTPLHGVIGMTEIIKKTELDQHQYELAEKMQTASNQLNRVISDLIDVSRSDTGNMSLEKSTFSLADILNWIEPVIGERADTKGLSFTISVSGDRDRVLISDKERIAQIIMNLTENAIKNTFSGRVKVLLSLRKESKHGNGMLLIQVEDTGEGIPEEEQEAIFTPFTKMKTTSEEFSSGLGLGLYIVKSITELLGGSIHLTSSPGKGSMFTVNIPIEDAEEQKPFSPSITPSLHSESREILIAEDEAINRLYLEQLLKNRGWNTTSVTNGEEVLEAFGNYTFDLILMDLSMPIIGGLKTSKKLRSIESQTGNAKTPIIALTAHAYEENKQDCLDAGMDGFISKPFHEDAFWKEIDRIMKSYYKPRGRG